MPSAIDRVTEVVESLAANRRGISALELAKERKMSRQTATRLLEMMTTSGLAVRDEDSRRYRLTLKIYEWAAQAAASCLPSAPVRQEIARLAEEERPHPIFYSVLDQSYIVTLERTQWSGQHIVTTPSATRRPWPESVSGIALVAFASPEVTGDVLAALGPNSSDSLRDETGAIIDLDKVRADGHAEQDRGPGRWAASVPILDYSGFAVASLSMGVANYNPDEREHLLGAVTETANRISVMLGHTALAVAP